ncbi:hypothetical protein IG631_02296 [Alternaria alternata]|nr:hypothetical protein IG631_02296 [Alternaria alternata]
MCYRTFHTCLTSSRTLLSATVGRLAWRCSLQLCPNTTPSSGSHVSAAALLELLSLALAPPKYMFSHYYTGRPSSPQYTISSSLLPT